MNPEEELLKWLIDTADTMGYPHQMKLHETASMAMGYKRAVLTARHEYKQLNLAFQNALDKITEQARRIKELEERK